MTRQEKRTLHKSNCKLLKSNHKLWKIIPFDMAEEIYFAYKHATHNKFTIHPPSVIQHSDYCGDFNGYLDVVLKIMEDEPVDNSRYLSYNEDFIKKLSVYYKKITRLRKFDDILKII